MIYSIALDGPGGAGKSTVARMVAARKGIIYVDTGAMYRRIALHMLRKGIDVSDIGRVAPELANVNVEIRFADGVQRIYLDGEDVSEAIRENPVSMAASTVSRHPEVRSFLLETQRGLARVQSVIMDGRDIGTVVLPDREVKIFMTADPRERAARRYSELLRKGQEVDFDSVLEDINRRDWQDTHRQVRPLKQADDAVLLDTTDLDLEQVVEAVIGIVDDRIRE